MGGVSRALLIELPSCAGPFIRASTYGGDLQSPSHFFGKNLSTSSGLWAFRLGFKKLHSKRCTLGLELRKATLNLCPWQMLQASPSVAVGGLHTASRTPDVIFCIASASKPRITFQLFFLLLVNSPTSQGKFLTDLPPFHSNCFPTSVALALYLTSKSLLIARPIS